MDALFTTHYAGSKVEVYPNAVNWSFAFKKNSIPLSQIASIEVGIPLYAQVIIETTGGKKFKIPVAPGQKKKLRDAILDAQSGTSNQGNQEPDNHISDLEKLAELKEKGIITEEEFAEKKKSILDKI
jgi:hypothetical protein